MSRGGSGRPVRPQVHWRASGRGAALVLINGWNASGRAWPVAWMRELARRYRLITPDNRGSGWSRHAETPFTMADLAGDVAAVLDAEEIERAGVLGISMGGMVAQELAMRAPERVEALFLVATRPPVPAYTQMPVTTAWQLVRPPGRGEALRAYYHRLWASSTAPGFAEAHPEVIDELARQVADRPTPRAMLVHQMRAMTGWGHAERLKSISAPTVVIHGTADPFVPVANGRAIARLVPGAQLVELDGVGHLVAHEAPDRLLELIAERLPPREGAAAPEPRPRRRAA